MLSYVPVRLVSGNGHSSGRVEVNYFGTWGTICHNNFDIVDANVICRQLGFNGATSVQVNAYYGPGNGTILLDDINCKGNESSIASCGHRPWGKNNCEHDEDVGVSCYGNATCELRFEIYT